MTIVHHLPVFLLAWSVSQLVIKNFLNHKIFSSVASYSGSDEVCSLVGSDLYAFSKETWKTGNFFEEGGSCS